MHNPSLSSHLPIQGQTVLIIGNWSYKNLGDELILLGTVKLLLAQQKTVIISCYDPQWLQGFFSQFIETKQVSFIHELPKGRRSAFQWLKKGGRKELHYFRTANTIILGGGEILTEENPCAYRYRLAGMRPFLLRVILNGVRSTKGKIQNKHQNGELVIMGGVQIPTTPRKQRLLRFLLHRTTHLYLRDFQALTAVKKFGFSNVDFFMDTSYFAYDWGKNSSVMRPVCTAEKGGREDGLCTTFSGNIPKPYLIINLNKNGERFLPDLLHDLQTYTRKGYSLYFVPIAKGTNATYNDAQYYSLLQHHLQTFQQQTNHPPITFELLDREADFAYFVQTLKKADLVITTRLHLFLIASFLGVPTKVYPYQKKILKMQEVIRSLPFDLPNINEKALG